MKTWSLFLISVLMSACAHAQSEGILRGSDHVPVTLQESVASVTPGSIVVIGENHGFVQHRDQQVAVLQALRAQGLKVSVGLEFFTYTQQNFVDSYRAGTLSEPEFLKAIQWGSPSYDYYRAQALFPNLAEGAQTLALNAPRSVTSAAAKKGLEGLSADEKSLLPPNFALGRDSYKRRFLSMMPHLPTPEAGERYFAAQSIWDDTMAWRAADFIKSHPDQVLVIVVGEFHVQYGGGLPDRLRVRLPNTPIVTFSQINTLGMEEDEIAVEIQPSIQDGPRADYLWLAPAQSLGL